MNYNDLLSLQIEFEVHMTCQKCVKAISESIADLEGIRNVDISLERGTVIVETNLPYSIIQEKIEKTGRQAVLKGYGGLNTFLQFFFNIYYKNVFVFHIQDIFESIRKEI